MKSFCETMTGATELWNKRPLNALHAQRAEGGESGAGAPAVRPQHVEAERENKRRAVPTAGKRRAVPTAGKRRAGPTAGKEKTVQQQSDEQ